MHTRQSAGNLSILWRIGADAHPEWQIQSCADAIRTKLRAKAHCVRHGVLAGAQQTRIATVIAARISWDD
jgi:hypothetical protein